MHACCCSCCCIPVVTRRRPTHTYLPSNHTRYAATRTFAMPPFPSLSQLRWSRARAYSRLYGGLVLNVIWMQGLSLLLALFKDGVVSATSDGTDTRIPNVEFNTLLFYRWPLCSCCLPWAARISCAPPCSRSTCRGAPSQWYNPLAPAPALPDC